jgi:hypothetical protein
LDGLCGCTGEQPASEAPTIPAPSAVIIALRFISFYLFLSGLI